MLEAEGAYTCGICGEQIVIPLDPSGGAVQCYVEDCPVCCHAHEITVTFDGDGDAQISAEPE